MISLNTFLYFDTVLLNRTKTSFQGCYKKNATRLVVKELFFGATEMALHQECFADLPEDRSSVPIIPGEHLTITCNSSSLFWPLNSNIWQIHTCRQASKQNVLSQFWRPETQNQGATICLVPWRSKKVLQPPPSLVTSVSLWPVTASLHRLCFTGLSPLLPLQRYLTLD